MIKHYVGVGFSLLYTYLMFTTTDLLTFVYAVPMLIAISIFNDFKYSLPIEIGMFVVNAGQLILFFTSGRYGYSDIATAGIQIIMVVLVVVAQLYTSKVSGKLQARQIADIEQSNLKTEKLLDNTMQISGQMIGDFKEVSAKVSALGESMLAMKEAMDEVNTGSNDTAMAVQKQLEQTEAIQRLVENVENGTDNIIESMKLNKDAIADGNENVGILVRQVEDTVESGSHVTGKLSELNEYMSQMHSILDIINEITTQTDLLALNASIEAARAGEAGKGFGVVASEISKMAQQTQDSTVRIEELIDNVSEAIASVVAVTNDMLEMIKSESRLAEKTAASFMTIEENSKNAFSRSGELSDCVAQLSKANEGIVDSISTISAISQEVAAHASDTQTASEENNEIVSEVVDMTGKLEELASQLNV
jgi:methyl-accepting chemotaxis protein